jgi:cation:H+ antiporter
VAKIGDRLAHKLGLSHAWVGIIFLSIITSLPEAANGISSVTIADAPDLAVSNIFGACVYDLMFLFILDIIQWVRKKKTIFFDFHYSNFITSIFALFLVAISILGIYFASLKFNIGLFNISIFTVSMLLVYLISQKVLFKLEVKDEEEEKTKKEGLLRDIMIFLFYGIIVVLAGIYLPFIGKEIARLYSWEKAFVGAALLGIATTLPEIVVSISALFIAPEMAIGNLVGSNLFNLSLMFVDDLFFRKGYLFDFISSKQVVLGSFNFLMLALICSAFCFKIKNRFVTFLLLLLFLSAFYFSF